MPGSLPAGPLVRCDGHLLERLQPSELKCIDSFHDPRFERIVVDVHAEDGFGGKEVVQALMYVCPHASGDLLDTSKPWNYQGERKTHAYMRICTCTHQGELRPHAYRALPAHAYRPLPDGYAHPAGHTSLGVHG